MKLVAKWLATGMMAFLVGDAFASSGTDALPGLAGQSDVAWQKVRTETATTSVQTSVDDSAFYTGKPYDSNQGDYVFKYRNYNPESARWTTADPSGFPDGANNQSYVIAPTSQVDSTGLSTINIVLTGVNASGNGGTTLSTGGGGTTAFIPDNTTLQISNNSGNLTANLVNTQTGATTDINFSGGPGGLATGSASGLTFNSDGTVASVTNPSAGIGGFNSSSLGGLLTSQITSALNNSGDFTNAVQSVSDILTLLDNTVGNVTITVE